MTTWTCDIQLTGGCARIFAPGKVPGKDRYAVAMTLNWIDAQTVELIGTVGEGVPFTAFKDSMKESLRQLGVERVVWVRKREGRPDRRVTFSTDTTNS